MRRKFSGLICVMSAAAVMFACCGAACADGRGGRPVERRTVYVSPEWLRGALKDGNVVAAEAAYGKMEDCESYRSAHIPGAIYVDICDVEDATGSPEGAYNLLPADVMERNALARGITKDTKVVLYGKDPAGVARQAYGYIWLGVEDVKILNGGLDAWIAAGYETEKSANTLPPAESFGAKVPANPQYWVSIQDARDRAANEPGFKLVSIRSEPEFLGITSGYGYMDKAGEPEGAVWGKGAKTAFDVADFLNEDGTVKDIDGFKDVWKDCNFSLDNFLAFYCGTGWRASVPFLVLYENGYDNIAVFDGGWYEWIMHDDYPVQVGDPADPKCVHTTVAELETGKAAKK